FMMMSQALKSDFSPDALRRSLDCFLERGTKVDVPAELSWCKPYVAQTLELLRNVAERGHVRQSSMRTCIIVAGMHRSGTSPTTRLINLLGADVARDLLPAQPDNPRGFWEPAAVVEIHDRLLAALGSSYAATVSL